MNLKSLALAAAIAVGVAPVFAADQPMVDLSSGFASFTGTSPILDGGDDVISFVNLAAGAYNFVLTISGQKVPNLAASFATQTVNVSQFGMTSFFGFLESSGSTPFALTLSGAPGAGAQYSGELSVTAVPEPESWVLMLAGLAGMGFVARRRRPQK